MSSQRTTFSQRKTILLSIATISVVVSGAYFVFSETSGENISFEMLTGITSSTDNAPIILETDIRQNYHPTQINSNKNQNFQNPDEFSSDFFFSKLENSLLTHNTIDPQTLNAILLEVDYTHQIDSQNMNEILDDLKPNQLIDSEIIVDKLYRLIYNEQMYQGPDLDVNAVAIELLSIFEDQEAVLEPVPLIKI